ncbi:DUF1611 domain-containing protein [Thalassobacillus sp. CUG 92003]|uniref:DUF1611 domain-containing protein n=1 Tax=Thalassobacillus sp. CUG 92003 TaxID=2736641 RepID=UPI0015E6B133|nr:DUF1611 domain-containing protein [Thalassobacillus sp. CUG 92003]
MKKTAIVYCENEFGTMDGKTANGLVRDSKKYEIVGVIDSTKAGLDAGECLQGEKNGIPIFASIDHAFIHLAIRPEYFIYGIAPSEAFLKENERKIVIEAMKKEMHIVNTLHEFFTDDAEFMATAKRYHVTIQDVRKPPQKKDLHLFSGRIFHIDTPVIAVLGTDGAVGKRTTAVLLEEALVKRGLNVALIATGQTGLIQGAKYGAAIDALPSQFITGEIENEIMKAHDTEHPDVVIVEGQGALSHPAYISSSGILKGARPGTVIVQHPPKRKVLGDFPFVEMPTLESEIHLIETFSGSNVMAVTINHENMTSEEIRDAIHQYETDLNIPVTDVLEYGCDKLVSGLCDTFPALNQKLDRVLVN